ncbi:MAG: alpha/beta hydrolase-fold protein [Candidatus Acidiferrales bacterium]
MNVNRVLVRLGALMAITLGSACLFTAHAQQNSTGIRFEISFTASVRNEPTTGRMFVAISPTRDPEPRVAAYNSARRRDARVPFFAVDVDQIKPGQPAVIDSTSIGFPYMDLDQLPAGDYYVQGILNVYTQFHRSDGHVIWAHMDQWEGQRWGFSPGNLLSEPQQVHLDPKQPTTVKITLTSVIPPIELPKDTEWVKNIKFQSKILTAFWGHPMYLGATVLLPKGYVEHPTVYYPVVYVQSHFSLNPAFDFSTEENNGPNVFAAMQKQAAGRKESGYEFYRSWNSDDLPRMIAVTFQHPTPYFDDSYAVNSANNGPYGDAIMQELIPYLEAHFRMIPKPYARVLTGGSTGGWESLALQVYHPDFFGGTWTMYPDPVDFRKYGMVNAYQDDSAFIVPDAPFNAPERMFQRDPDGQAVASIRQISQMEYASGTHDRSGAQIDIWDAVYGPVGDDGYPRPLWDHLTGQIDHSVANYMRDHGYDLREYLQTNWPKIGPQLVGKLRIYCGDMDNFYLAGAVYHLEDFLKTTNDPYYAGEFVYGRPMKGHGWQPMTNAELIRMMADQIAKNAPAEENTSSWKGK